jgi:hypothetical protein
MVQFWVFIAGMVILQWRSLTWSAFCVDSHLCSNLFETCRALQRQFSVRLPRAFGVRLHLAGASWANAGLSGFRLYRRYLVMFFSGIFFFIASQYNVQVYAFTFLVDSRSVFTREIQI